MNLRQKQTIEAYRRTRDFVNEHPLEPPATYGAPKAVLDDVIERLTTHTTDQVMHDRQGRAETRKQKALKRVLREVHLHPISQVARAVLREAPGIDVALRLPNRQMPVTRLIAEARAVRSAVTAYQPVFVSNGAPADFLEQLDAAIAAVEASIQDRARNQGTRSGARFGIAQEVRRGREAVMLLDAVVTRHFANNHDVLAHWRAATRVKLLGVIPRGGAETPDDIGGAPPLRAA